MSMSMTGTLDHVSKGSARAVRRPAVLVLLLAMASVALAACAPSPADTNTTAINALRATVGLPELVRAPELDAKAQAQAEKMARKGTIFHSKNLAAGVPDGWTGIGENVAMAGSIEQAQVALEASPGHYANMTGAYTQVGIGVVTRNGYVYLVQVFVNR